MIFVGCNETTNVEHLFGEVRSENHPYNYGPNSNCFFKIQTYPGRKIRLKFETIEIADRKCRDDYLSIEEDNKETQKICGNDADGHFRGYSISTCRTMFL